VSISRRARASAQSLVCTKLCAPDPDSLPPRRDLLGLGLFRDPFFDLEVDRVPARSYRRSLLTTSLVLGDPGELGPLPLGYFSLGGAQQVGWDFRARVGAARRRPRSSRPMSAAHGCCFQRRSPHVSAHVASSCSHTMRGLADSRRNARFGEPSDGAEVLSPSTADLVGVPLMLRRSRASPAERCPPASARDRITISGRKTLEPRPTRPSRVNGSLGLALARSTFSLRSLFHSDRRPDPGAPAAAPFRDAASREANEASAVSPTHEAQVRASNPLGVAPRSFRNAAPRAAWTAPFPEPPIRPVVPPRQGDRCARVPSGPCGPVLTRPSRSPPTSSAPTPSVIDG
jgi:hypothetical protein